MNKFLNSRLLIFSFILLFASNVQARHIIGGVMTYECTSAGEYKFTLKVYRDCNCTNCAELDPVAFIAAYECDVGEDCHLENQSSYYTRINVPLGPVSFVEAPDYPCLIPPNVCVQEGIYTFTLELPVSDKSYHISYQRCCRNVTINNIINPENAGATYAVEITPEAQQVCNDSPTFNDFPPTVICAGQELVFDHSATDPDGDQLVYEFCSPVLGGGPLLDGVNYNSCAGANPIPACPPPYNSVSFLGPTYSAAMPMAGNPVVTIDPNTGIISGVPEILGQFVVSVCVSEYRDGVFLGKVYRDFQFNVASCDPTVIADIEADEIIGAQEFVINSCGENTVTFVNDSYEQQYIDSYRWIFDINGTPQYFDEWNPSVTFPGIGTYQGTLLLNEGTECGDTALINVNIFPSINANFTSAYDTCVAGPVNFTDLSTTGSGFLTAWDWKFGDQGSSSAKNPSHIYTEPGNIPVTLTVRDTNKCVDEATKIIEYFPVPALIVVAPSSYIGCSPADIFFNNLSFPIDSTYDINWDFGDGGSGYDISPSHTYYETGVYTVAVEIISPIGCQTDTVFNDLITVEPSPEAGFSYLPEEPSNINADINFIDESKEAVNWYWEFGTGDYSYATFPSYSFPDTGLYKITQVVTHMSGCKDTLIKFLDIRPEIRFYLPNAFTPNQDSVNDEYKGKGVLLGLKEFNMSIWSRWGQLVYETNNPKDGWDGTKMNSGKDAPPGVYLVLVRYTGPRGDKFEIKGIATLLR